MSMASNWMGNSTTGRKRRLLLAALAAAGLLTAIASVWLWAAGRGDAVEEGASISAVSIEGFRAAQFGSDENAVRAAIAKDFGKSGDAIKIIDNPVERTRVLVVRSDNLFAESTQAEIGYVFGYKSKTLIQVNILWGTPLTPAVTQGQLATVAATLTRYFASQGVAPHRVTRNKKLGNGGVLVFQGTDAKGHMVQLVQRMEVAKADASKKRMTLRLAYIVDPKQPDVFRIAKGAF